MESRQPCRRRKIGTTRFQVNCDVHISRRSGEDSACEGLGVVRNLSMRGALLETHVLVSKGDRVTLDVTIPQQSDPLVIADVAVRWIQGGQVGVEFLKLDAATSRQLMLFLAATHGAKRLGSEDIETKMPAIA